MLPNTTLAWVRLFAILHAVEDLLSLPWEMLVCQEGSGRKWLNSSQRNLIDERQCCEHDLSIKQKW
jgi:hypothetical protein